VDGIERDGAVSNQEFFEQLLCRGDFVGLLVDLDVRQDQAGFDIESVQHLGCLAVGEVVEASPQRLAVECDGSMRRVAGTFLQGGGMTAEYLFDRGGIEALKDIANGGMGRGTLPVQAAGGVQPAAMHRDEGLDGAEGIASGDHGEDREQQDIGQLVQLTLGPARVGDLPEHGEKLIERAHGNLLDGGLPAIDSGILPRRNPAFASDGRISPTVAAETQSSPPQV
jgi:hypothetical protein